MASVDDQTKKIGPLPPVINLYLLEGRGEGRGPERGRGRYLGAKSKRGEVCDASRENKMVSNRTGEFGSKEGIAGGK